MKNYSTDIIIIGAGISGLAAGCYAQMNGYHTNIFEMHNLPGGFGTAADMFLMVAFIICLVRGKDNHLIVPNELRTLYR